MNLQQTTTNGPSNQVLKEQIRQTIQDATQAARDAAQAQRDAALAERDAARLGIPILGHRESIRDIPPRVEGVAYAFFFMLGAMVILGPLARAFGRRIERRPEAASLNPQMADQLARIEQAVDAMSVEVERISESQRFMARLQSESPAAQNMLGNR